jgi:hypothetical protein
MLPTQPMDATVDDVAWMGGRWIGEHEADRIEEWWSEPHAGMMLGMFRWHRNGEARFYELMSMEPEESRLVFRIKHFAPGLLGWEEKDAAVTLDLVRLSDGEAVFLKRGEERWMVYQHQAGTRELLAWFETPTQPYAPGEEFRYERG